MLDAFHVVVPTLHRRLPGVLRPVEGPLAGVLLLDGTDRKAPLVQRLYDELELYYQAANLATLRIVLPQHATLGTRVSGVMGGVMLLRSMGAGNVLVITSALDPLATWNEARDGTLAELMDLAQRGRALPEIIQIVRDLIVTIREVADSTIGVATLLVTPPLDAVARASASGVLAERAGRAGSGRWDTSERTGRIGAEQLPASASPPALLLPLPDAGDAASARRALPPLLSRLYSWSLALAQGSRAGADMPREDTLEAATDAEAEAATEAATSATDGARVADDMMTVTCWSPPAVESSPHDHRDIARAEWVARLLWADSQWERLLQQQITRTPAQSLSLARVEASSMKSTGSTGARAGASLRAARSAWPLLDCDTRREWLTVCSWVFAPHDEAVRSEPVQTAIG